MKTSEITNEEDALVLLNELRQKYNRSNPNAELSDIIAATVINIEKLEKQSKLSLFEVNVLIGLNLLLKVSKRAYDKETTISYEDMVSKSKMGAIVYGDGSSWTKSGGWTNTFDEFWGRSKKEKDNGDELYE